MFNMEEKKYYTYMIRCEDESLYTGITTDLKRRFLEHYAKLKEGAKYTKKHSVKKMEIAWSSNDRKLASKMEYHLKRLHKTEKENLILNPKLLKKLLENRLEIDEYKKVSKKVINDINCEVK